MRGVARGDVHATPAHPASACRRGSDGVAAIGPFPHRCLTEVAGFGGASGEDALDELVVRGCLVSPFASAAGQPQICSETHRLPADAAADVIRQVPAELEAALFDELEQSLGWPVDRSWVRFIVREPVV
jgi:hypothetical protein